MYGETDALRRDSDDLWRHDGSRIAVRGPDSELRHPYLAVLGGSETFGRGVEQPYPELLARRLDMPVMNLGVMHAGASLFSNEPWLLDMASRARLTVLQVTGAQNMSNRLYCVHSRRNDRFLTCSDNLRRLYPEIDFTEFNFTGHLMGSLRKVSEDRFRTVLDELRWAWVQRMHRIISVIQSDVMLLWMSERSPDDPADNADCGEPTYVTRDMLNELLPETLGVAEVVRKRPRAAVEDAPYGCSDAEAPLHEAVAECLAGRLDALIPKSERGPGLAAEPLNASGDGPDQSFSMSSGTAVKRSATRP